MTGVVPSVKNQKKPQQDVEAFFDSMKSQMDPMFL